MPKRPRRPVFPPPLFPAVLRADDAVLRRIVTTADSGTEAERHYAALRQTVRQQNSFLTHQQGYYPADAVELAAENAAAPAAFVLSQLIIIQSEAAQTCRFTPGMYWRHYQNQRGQLSERLQAELDAALYLPPLGRVDIQLLKRIFRHKMADARRKHEPMPPIGECF